MRVVVRALVTIVVVVMTAMPATAGTRSKPEVVDPCGVQVHSDNERVDVVHESIDLCSVWFASPSPGVLDVHLATSGNLEERPGGFYKVLWGSGRCIYSVTVDDSIQAAVPRKFTADCGEPVRYDCLVPVLYCQPTSTSPYSQLSTSRVSVSGKEMRIRVPFKGALARYASAHDQGSVLTSPRAFTALAVGPTSLVTLGCVPSVCYTVNGDDTGYGRNYTVPR